MEMTKEERGKLGGDGGERKGELERGSGCGEKREAEDGSGW
jgi:hypothetical protein